MRYLPRAAAVLLFGCLALPAVAADKDKAKDKADAKKDADKSVTTEKMYRAGQLAGKVLTVVESKKSIRLQVTLNYPKLNPGALNSMLQAQNSMQQAAYNRDPNARAQGMLNAQRQMLQAQATLYQMQSMTKDVELQTTEDVKVRLAQPPQTFDDKGKVKRYTAKELKELRGPDPKVPGYNAEFSDLREGQVVTVTLVKKKGAPTKLPPRRPVKDPKDAKDVDADLLLENLPQISMILIVAEPKN
ncbi:MAG TPA: hypothetical protein VFE78_19200 [Gemmataceae bacterium]|jgi:hypothetical protein|nr:hypothetical protein [Gemmataceae bacterium]